MFGGQFSEDEGDGCVADDSLPKAWIWISGEADRDVSLTRLRWPLLGSQTITSSIEQQIRVVWSQNSIRIEETPVANQNHNRFPYKQHLEDKASPRPLCASTLHHPTYRHAALCVC